MLVRNTEDEKSIGLQHSEPLVDRCPGVLDVLQAVTREDSILRSVWKRQPAAIVARVVDIDTDRLRNYWDDVILIPFLADIQYRHS